LKITTQPAGEREVSLVIEVDEERLKKARRKTAREISREVDIPGFRKGKAPYDVIVQRLGERVVQQELVATLAESVYPEALLEEEIVPYAPGALEDTSFEPMTLTFTVPLVPEVELGDYRELRLDPPEVEVPEEMMEEALEGIREQNVVLAPLDRPSAKGDLLVARLEGRTSEGVSFLDEEEARVILDPEAGDVIPGLIDALIGLETGEERTFTLVIPEDFKHEELAGAEAEFEVAVETVYERILPELDDDLARTVGNYESFDELKDSVRERIRERLRAQAEGEYAEEVLHAVIDNAEISYPAVMLDEGVEDALETYKEDVEREHHMMLEDYLRIQGQSMDEVREDVESEVRHTLERSLVLGEIVEQEGLEISDDALDAQIAVSSEQYGENAERVRETLNRPEQRRGLRNRMLASRAVQRLVTIAKGELEEGAEAEVQESSDADVSVEAGGAEDEEAGAPEAEVQESSDAGVEGL